MIHGYCLWDDEVGYDLSNLEMVATDVQVKVLIERITARTPQAVELSFCVGNYCLFKADPGDTVNLLAGLTRRVAIATPKTVLPKREWRRNAQKFVNRTIRRWHRSGLLRPLEPVSVIDLGEYFESWLARTNYPESRKEQLRTEFLGVLGDGGARTPKRVQDWTTLEDGHVLRDFGKSFDVGTFVKDEFYDAPKPLRLINAGVDYRKCLFGPIFKQIEKEVCKLPHFVKYVAVLDRPRAIWDRLFNVGSTYDTTDYTSFESHFKQWVMRAFEEPLYKFMLSNCSSQVCNVFIAMWRSIIAGISVSNKLVFGGRRRHMVAWVNATRMSGEMNTSLGNGWVNLLVYLWSRNLNGAPLEDLDRVSGFVEGDDGIFIHDEFSPTTEQLSALGFRLKIEVIDDLCKASFCGQVFDEEYRVVTDPIKVILKLGWGQRDFIASRQKSRDELLLSKALSALFQYNGCPIIAPICKRIVAELRKRNVDCMRRARTALGSYKFEMLEEAFTPGWVQLDVKDCTRNLVARLYGISVSEQLDIEERLCAWNYGDRVYLDLPPQYEVYRRAYLNYVDYPSVPDPGAREKMLERIRHVYVQSGATLAGI